MRHTCYFVLHRKFDMFKMWNVSHWALVTSFQCWISSLLDTAGVVTPRKAIYNWESSTRKLKTFFDFCQKEQGYTIEATTSHELVPLPLHQSTISHEGIHIVLNKINHTHNIRTRAAGTQPASHQNTKTRGWRKHQRMMMKSDRMLRCDAMRCNDQI